MKKLLGILGTIITAGSGVVGLIGNAPAPTKNETNYKQTSNLEQLIRVKKQSSSSALNIEYDSASTWNKMLATFSSGRVLSIINDYNNSDDFNTFKNKFYGLMYTGIWKDYRVTENYINSLAKCIWDNWKKILRTWNNSGQNRSLQINCWAYSGEIINHYII